MSLNGIDISSYQSDINLSVVPADFVIVKLTQGAGYVNPDCTRAVNQALAAGKLVGGYMYVSGGNAIAEADHFISVARPWLGRITLWVDWESGGNSAWGNTAYLDAVVKRIKTVTGVTVGIYASSGAFPRAVAAANCSPTWVAQYASMAPTGYQPAPWNEGAYQANIRQYSSAGRLNGWGGSLDLNKYYGTREQWLAWAGNGDNDMTNAADVWNYELGENATAGRNNQPAWVRLSWVHHDTALLVQMLTRRDDAGLKDGTNGDLYTRIVWMDKRIRDMSATTAAQAAAIEALANAVGTNPTDIGQIVTDAVKSKLEGLSITVTDKEDK